ncbi:MAG: HD-GYP domain-containing protein [Actinobacteria bacterium]|jgi:ribonuclease P protein subunit RPR2|nr:HD-GYP domain-containing protein [Actinomycetota bacterium]MCL6095819.1 HD-GYP domain-containing protein [Actinomycetota bacterium]
MQDRRAREVSLRDSSKNDRALLNTPVKLSVLDDMATTIAALGSFSTTEQAIACALQSMMDLVDASKAVAYLVSSGKLVEMRSFAHQERLDKPADSSPRSLLRLSDASGQRLKVKQIAKNALARKSTYMSEGGDYLGLVSSLAGSHNQESDPLAVVVLHRAGKGFSQREITVLLPLMHSLGIALERIRVSELLEIQMAKAVATRQQLNAYVKDLRTTWEAERARAAALNKTLEELEQTYRATVQGLAVAVEAKDEYTAGHLVRVSKYGMAITELVAPEHKDDPEFEYGFLLHDIGKLAVPDRILGKPGKLTDDEWVAMREHPSAGSRILEGIPFLAGARQIVYEHHERWDGKGYPLGLTHEEICLGARIFPLTDAFDAMTTDRPYRRALSFEQALKEIRDNSGTQFWPDAVDAFLSIPRDRLDDIHATPVETAFAKSYLEEASHLEDESEAAW